MDKKTDTKFKSVRGVRTKQILTWVACGVGLIAVIMMVLKLQENPAVSEEKAAVKIRKKLKGLSSEDQAQDIWIEKSEKKLKFLEETVKEQTEALKRLTSIIERDKKSNDRKRKKNKKNSDYPPGKKLPVIPPFNTNKSSSNIIPAQPSSSNRKIKGKTVKRGAIRVIMGTPNQKKEGKKDPKEKEHCKKGPDKCAVTKKTYLSAATFIPTILLSGLDAPTGGQAQRNPHPVLLLIQDLSSMPTYIQRNAKECRILASGYGSLSSERAYIRGETITCKMKNGKIIEKPVKGYLAGEDGKNGLRGRVVEKAGKYLAYALAAGFAEGVGEGFKTATNTISVSPLGTTSTVDTGKLLESGAYSGGASAMERLADYYIKKADDIFAIIEVDASRKIDFVVLEGVELI